MSDRHDDDEFFAIIRNNKPVHDKTSGSIRVRYGNAARGAAYEVFVTRDSNYPAAIFMDGLLERIKKKK